MTTQPDKREGGGRRETVVNHLTELFAVALLHLIVVRLYFRGTALVVFTSELCYNLEAQTWCRTGSGLHCLACCLMS